MGQGNERSWLSRVDDIARGVMGPAYGQVKGAADFLSPMNDLELMQQGGRKIFDGSPVSGAADYATGLLSMYGPGDEILDAAKLAMATAPAARAANKVALETAQQVADAAPSARAARSVDDALSRLKSAYASHGSIPANPGGQQVALLLPDGQYIAENVPSHNMLMRNAGIDEPLETFMGRTGTIRMHGPDTAEIHGRPTQRQIRELQYALDQTGIHVDAVDAEGNLFSDFVMDSTELNSLLRRAGLLGG